MPYRDPERQREAHRLLMARRWERERAEREGGGLMFGLWTARSEYRELLRTLWLVGGTLASIQK